MFRPAFLIAFGAVVLGGSPSAWAQEPAATATRDFVKAAAASDQYEILAGRVALIEGQERGLRTFANQMIADHTQTSEALQQASLASGLTPPPKGLSGDGQKMLAELQSLRGSAFDKAYLKQQVLAHQSALVVEQGYATSGADPNVRRAAQSAVPVIRRHLDMARRMQATL